MLQLLAVENDLEQSISRLSIKVVIIAAIILAILVLLSILIKDRVPKSKKWLFGGLAATLALPTLFLIVSTVYLNLKADSGGPVHWHAEVEFWACGAELELRDPVGLLSNKVGTSTYHEHNDKHIHLEGVVVRRDYDASLGKFMTVTGGYLNETGLGVPLNQDEATWFSSGNQMDGDEQLTDNFTLATADKNRITYAKDGPVLNLKNGENCGDNQQPAEVQTFVYNYNEENDTYSQRKLESSAEAAKYVIRDESALGPPADCIIFEFDTPRDRTDKLCEQYGVVDSERCESFGVKKYSSDLCKARQVTPDGGNL